MQTNIDLILEKISLPEHIEEKLQKQTVRKEMLVKYGKEAFLIPEELKFPVVNPETGKLDIRLIYIAYLKSKKWEDEQPSYKAITEKAKQLFINNKGPEELLDVQIEESLVDTLLSLITNNKINEPKTTAIPNPTCNCPNCGFICALGSYSNCSVQACPICDTYMQSSDLCNESVENKFNKLVTETVELPKGKSGDKFICPKCRTIVNYNIKEAFDIEVCPLCKQSHMVIMFETINSEIKHNICPTCQSIFEYDQSKTLDACPICGQLFIVI